MDDPKPKLAHLSFPFVRFPALLSRRENLALPLVIWHNQSLVLRVSGDRIVSCPLHLSPIIPHIDLHPTMDDIGTTPINPTYPLLKTAVLL